ncbi:MAG TPA: peptidylprolyl isomerase, partial [Ilumatobacteraceae bacterium]|nr:peptidylprolyl isomerase [Ilumatobacteraceae bacterium]
MGKAYAAVLETNHGTLHIALRADIAPKTVNSFVNLARYHYFDGTTCHRAIQNFVVQCGDPTATGGGGPGYEFQDELPQEPYTIGSIAMANAGPNTNGSQFFIITGGNGAALPPNYSL